MYMKDHVASQFYVFLGNNISFFVIIRYHIHNIGVRQQKKSEIWPFRQIRSEDIFDLKKSETHS